MTTTPPDLPAHTPVRRSRPTGTTGQLLLIVGAKLFALSLLLPLSWIAGSSYDAIGDRQLDDYHRDFPSLWFNGLAWIVLALLVLAGLAGTIPFRLTLVCQFLGAALVIGSLVVAYAATSALDADGDFGPAVYLAVAGHVAMLIGCVVGPWRRDGYRASGTDDEQATALAGAIASL